MNSDKLRTSRLCAFVANKCSAFQAGFRRGFMPQNKFYGYENSAFQAKNTFEYRNPSQWKPSIHRLTFAWKAITFITAGHDLRTKTSLPLLPERQNYCSCTDKYPCRRKAKIRLPVFAPSWRIKVLPFRQGESCRFTPQNKFYGYENSAFQAKKHSEKRCVAFLRQ